MFAVCSDWWKCSRPTQFPSTGVGAGNQSDAREVNCTTYHLRYSLALTSVHSLWPVVLSLIAIHPPNPLIHPFYNESVEVPCIYFLYGLVQTIYFSPVRLALDDYITTGIALVDRNSKREASSTPTVSPLVCWARLPQTYQLDELVKIGAIHLYATCRVTSSILVRFWYYIPHVLIISERDQWWWLIPFLTWLLLWSTPQKYPEIWFPEYWPGHMRRYHSRRLYLYTYP
jgi:hypothetical protein